MEIRNIMLTPPTLLEEEVRAAKRVVTTTPLELQIERERKKKEYINSDLVLLAGGQQPLISITGQLLFHYDEPDICYLCATGFISYARPLSLPDPWSSRPTLIDLETVYNSINDICHPRIRIDRDNVQQYDDGIYQTARKPPQRIGDLISCIVNDARSNPIISKAQVFLKTVNEVELKIDALDFCYNNWGEISLLGCGPTVTFYLYNYVHKQIQPEVAEPKLIALEFGR